MDGRLNTNELKSGDTRRTKRDATRRNIPAPKLVSSGDIPWEGVAPDGDSLLIHQNGVWALRSIQKGSTKPLPAIHSSERPIAWAADSKHLFTQTPGATSVRIDKLDLDSGTRESWQIWKPKDAAGVLLENSLTSMSPDGRWMVVSYRTHLGQIYSSDTLK